MYCAVVVFEGSVRYKQLEQHHIASYWMRLLKRVAWVRNGVPDTVMSPNSRHRRFSDGSFLGSVATLQSPRDRLTGCSSWANLTNADLRGAKLSEAKLDGAQLINTDFRHSMTRSAGPSIRTSEVFRSERTSVWSPVTVIYI